MSKTWMVRAQRGGLLFDVFKEQSVVAIGWSDVGSLESLTSRASIAKRIAEEYSGWHPQKISMCAGQLYRFRNEIKPGEGIVTYDPGRRVYLVGTVTGDYRFDPTVDIGNPNVRSVEWEGEVSRDLLAAATKNSLGAISTLFLIPKSAASDLARALKTQEAAPEAIVDDTESAAVDLQDIEARALEATKDRVMGLDWDQMQELVAGLLRAMGYKTQVSPVGSDRGKDIVASPDGFGFESPRIVVEVKHRRTAMGSPDIRSFLGGRHNDDKGLYVSTGGFTKDAYYEAERASIPVTLMNINDLVEALTDHYEKLDIESKQLLPLKRLYWPA